MKVGFYQGLDYLSLDEVYYGALPIRKMEGCLRFLSFSDFCQKF